MELETSAQTAPRAFFQTGFRPFFLGAGLWAVVSVLLWFGVLNLGWRFDFNGLSASNWHAHEMVFGYALAVIAGFLLTAVPNWTATKPVSGFFLGTIFASWCVARFANLMGFDGFRALAGIADMLFVSLLFIAIVGPIVHKGQWRQSGVMVKVLLLAAANLVFYLGTIDLIENGVRYGLFSAFYLIIALVFTIGRRVIPGFIERRLELNTALKNYRWIDVGGIVLFLAFFIAEVFVEASDWAALFAAVLFVMHFVRLVCWHRAGIWRDALLWVLWVAYAMLTMGFGLKALAIVGYEAGSVLALHLFAIGGIGLISCGMMSRVALGHTGRNLRQAPKPLTFVFACLALCALVRVFLPMLTMKHYLIWVAVSQGLWIAAFACFVFVYFPILISARVDGKPG